MSADEARTLRAHVVTSTSCTRESFHRNCIADCVGRCAGEALDARRDGTRSGPRRHICRSTKPRRDLSDETDLGAISQLLPREPDVPCGIQLRSPHVTDARGDFPQPDWRGVEQPLIFQCEEQARRRIAEASGTPRLRQKIAKPRSEGQRRSGASVAEQARLKRRFRSAASLPMPGRAPRFGLCR